MTAGSPAGRRGDLCGADFRAEEPRRFFGSAPVRRRLCVTEAAIDALSLSALEGRRADTLYASTAGGWSPATEGAVTLLAGGLDLVVAATDRNSQGEVYADKLRQIASRQDCGFQRLRPIAGDWNEDLQQRRE
ncbi:hypothetical protein AJ87_08960 [Rhizobium yanglingense]|nr:hypothetical protein AJ87_08960 [Rhizobium yanglingense]